MWGLLIGFVLGCLWTRTYYARINIRTDWMKSSNWCKHPLYQKIHRWNCELCPKRWYCERYKKDSQ